MSRGKDFAVGGFWLVALILFIAGQQQRLYLPERDKHKADPLFYTGIVLIAIATPVLLCYLVIRVSRSGAAARVAESTAARVTITKSAASGPIIATEAAARRRPVVGPGAAAAPVARTVRRLAPLALLSRS